MKATSFIIKECLTIFEEKNYRQRTIIFLTRSPSSLRVAREKYFPKELYKKAK